jgi:hypothetical protein
MLWGNLVNFSNQESPWYVYILLTSGKPYVCFFYWFFVVALESFLSADLCGNWILLCRCQTMLWPSSGVVLSSMFQYLCAGVVLMTVLLQCHVLRNVNEDHFKLVTYHLVCRPFGRLWWDETVATVVTRAEPHNQVTYLILVTWLLPGYLVPAYFISECCQHYFWLDLFSDHPSSRAR